MLTGTLTFAGLTATDAPSAEAATSADVRAKCMQVATKKLATAEAEQRCDALVQTLDRYASTPDLFAFAAGFGTNGGSHAYAYAAYDLNAIDGWQANLKAATKAQIQAAHQTGTFDKSAIRAAAPQPLAAKVVMPGSTPTGAAGAGAGLVVLKRGGSVVEFAVVGIAARAEPNMVYGVAAGARVKSSGYRQTIYVPFAIPR
jgi:hypothetical protein